MHLQYNIGAGWNDLPTTLTPPSPLIPTSGVAYWDPDLNGGSGTIGTWPFTGAWARITVAIPPVAQTASTQFRWVQFNTSGTAFDNWGLDNITITSTISGDWNFGNGITITNSETPSVTYNAAGTYTVNVTGQFTNGATCTASTSVTVNPAPTITFNASPTATCSGDPVNLTATGGNQYQWSTGAVTTAGLLTVNPMITTDYTVTVVDINQCRTTSPTQTINVAQRPAASVSMPGGAACGSSTVNLTASGGVSYQWSTGDNTPSITTTVTKTTVVQASIFGANGCPTIINTVIPIYAPPTITVDNLINPGCTGSSEGLIDLSYSVASDVTYSDFVTLRSDIGTLNATPNQISFTPGVSLVDAELEIQAWGDLESLGEVFDIEDENGNIIEQVGETAGTDCSNSVTAVIPLNAAQLQAWQSDGIIEFTITPDASVDIQGCPSGNSTRMVVTLRSRPVGYSVSWSPNGETTDDINNLTAGTYTVTAESATGCTTTQSFNLVNVNPLGTSAVVTDASCPNTNDGSVDLTVTGGSGNYNFLWTPGNLTVEDPTGLAPGTYTVQINENNTTCTASRTVMVGVTGAAITASVTATDTEVCIGESITLTASGGVMTAWNTGAMTDVIAVSVTQSATYTATVTGANGCQDTESVFIEARRNPVITLNNLQTAACDGTPNGFIDIDATIPDAALVPPNFSQSATLSAPTGFNTLIIPGTNLVPAGITTVATLTVRIVGNMETSPVIILDENNNTFATIAPTGVATDQCNDVVTEDISISNTDLAAWNASGSVGGSNVIFPVNAVPTFAGCGTGFVELTLNIAYSSNEVLTYAWTPNGEVTQDISNLATGTYGVTATDQEGCSTSATYPLATPGIVLSNTVTPVCGAGNSNAAIDLNVTGGSGVYTYQWSGSSTATTEDLTNITAGTYTITVNDTGGCSTSQTIVVNAFPVPTASLTVSATRVCENNMITLNATGAGASGTYLWSTGATSTTIQDVPTVSTTYTVTVRTVNGCTDSESVFVLVDAAPVFALSASPSGQIASGATVTLSISSSVAYSYLWGTGATSTTITVNPTATTTYMVMAQNAAGCFATESITVQLRRPANPTRFIPVPVVPPRNLEAQGVNTYTMKLTWTDIATNEIGYWVWRADKLDGVDGPNKPFRRIATIGPGSGEMEYIDSVGLIADQRYAYQVMPFGPLAFDRSNVDDGATFPNVPTLISGGDLCEGETQTLEVTNDHKSQRYRWYADSAATTPIGYSYSAETPYELPSYTLRDLAPGTYTYYVTARGFRHESFPRLPITFTVNPQPIAIIVDSLSTITSCDSTGVLTAFGDSTLAYTYEWIKNGDQVVGTSQRLVVNDGGDYAVRVTANGCTNISSSRVANVSFVPNLVLTADNVNACQTAVLSVEAALSATNFRWERDGLDLGLTGREITVTESGTYQVFADQAGCQGSSATLDVTINQPGAIVNPISLTAPNIILCQGETLTLTATDVPGAEYTWFWKGDVVEVNNSNTFTAYGEGEWGVSVDYNDVCNSQSTLATTEVEFYPFVFSLLRRDDQGLFIEVLDGSTPASVDWFYNYDPAPQYANQMRINPALPELQGSYNALVTYQSGCSDETNLVRFYPDQGTRGSDATAGNAYLLYPNPNDGRFTLSIPSEWSGKVSFQLVDNLGKSLANFQIEDASAINEYQFEVQDLPEGTYFLEIRTEMELFIEKVVKAR